MGKNEDFKSKMKNRRTKSKGVYKVIFPDGSEELIFDLENYLIEKNFDRGWVFTSIKTGDVIVLKAPKKNTKQSVLNVIGLKFEKVENENQEN